MKYSQNKKGCKENKSIFLTKVNKQAFTLVELIVVIIILTILGTIVFISFQGYSASARDARRLADIQNIKKSLELFSLNTGKYPLADDYFTISYSGELARHQGTVGDKVAKNLSKNLSKKPTDPLTNLNYIYSTTHSQTEYEVLAIYETNFISMILDKALAADTSFPVINGTYNGLYVKTPNYYVPTPSIINGNVWGDIDLKTDTEAIKSQVTTGGDNIPGESTGGLDITLDVYEGTITEDSTDEEKTDLIEVLQDVYSGTDLVDNGTDDNSIYDDLLSKTSTSEKVDFVDNVVIKGEDCSSVSDGSSSWGGIFYETQCDGNGIIYINGSGTGSYESEAMSSGGYREWESINIGATGHTVFVRSCNNPEFTGVPWIELGSDNYYDLSVDDNPYFQYKIDLSEGGTITSVDVESSIVTDPCASWNGTYSNMECNGGVLTLSDGYTSGTYTSESVDLGSYKDWESIDVGTGGNTLYVRSCNDLECNGESWIELGTNSYYDLDIDDNPYFQYKIDFVDGGTISDVNIGSTTVTNPCASWDGTYSNIECDGGVLYVSDGYTSGTYTSDSVDLVGSRKWESIDVGTGGNTIYVRSCYQPECSGVIWIELGTNGYYDLDVDDNPYFQYKIDFVDGGTIPNVDIVSSSVYITSSECSDAGWTWVSTDVYIGTTQGDGFCISPRFGDWNSDSETGNGGLSWNGWGNYSSGIYDGWDANGYDDVSNSFSSYGQTRILDSYTSYNCKSLGSSSTDYIGSDSIVGRMKWIAGTGNNYNEAQSIAWIVEDGTNTPLSTVNGHAIPALYIADCIDGVKDLTTNMTYTHRDNSTDQIIYSTEYSVDVSSPDVDDPALGNVTYQNRQKYLTAWTQKSGSHLPSAFSYIDNNTSGGEFDATYGWNMYTSDNAKGEYQIACEAGLFGAVSWNEEYQEYAGASDHIDGERNWLSAIGMPSGQYWGMSARFVGYYGCGIQDSTPTVNRFGFASARFVVRP